MTTNGTAVALGASLVNTLSFLHIPPQQFYFFFFFFHLLTLIDADKYTSQYCDNGYCLFNCDFHQPKQIKLVMNGAAKSSRKIYI